MSSSFWEFLWLIFSAFFLVAYLMLLFQILADLIRDRSMGGFAKALWVIALIVLPFLTALAYLIFRGGGLASRQQAEVREVQAEADAYIRRVAGTSPADQISQAQALLKQGTITDAEFAALKAKALAA
jgi:hypothetical protein